MLARIVRRARRRRRRTCPACAPCPTAARGCRPRCSQRAMALLPDVGLRQRLRPDRDQLDHRRARPRRPPGGDQSGDPAVGRPARRRPASRCRPSRSRSATRTAVASRPASSATSWCAASRSPASTSAAAAPRDAEGWFATRDRGYLDDDGYLFIEGRADDTIIRGGENIAPAEIEEVLLHHPTPSPTAPSSASPTTSGASASPPRWCCAPGATVDPGQLRAHVRQPAAERRRRPIASKCGPRSLAPRPASDPPSRGRAPHRRVSGDLTPPRVDPRRAPAPAVAHQRDGEPMPCYRLSSVPRRRSVRQADRPLGTGGDGVVDLAAQ